MTIERDLILLLSERSTYYDYSRFIRRESVSEETYTIIQAIGEYYKRNASIDAISWKSFSVFFCISLHPKMGTKLSVFRSIFDDLESNPDPDEEVVNSVIGSLIERSYAAKIAERALEIADGDGGNLESVGDMLESYLVDTGKATLITEHIVTTDIEGVIGITSAPGFKWRMDCLNASLGDLRKGDLVVVSTRPDTGKTTFLTSESTFIAEQMEEDQIVLWINNEEAGNKVLHRIVQSALGITSAALRANPKKAAEEYEALMGRADKIKVFDKADVHVRDVEALIRKYNVGLIVFDQLWKVHGFDAEAGTEVARQTMLFGWARELAKKVAPVLNVHQADGTAEGQKWIDMSRLYGSKTGVQGEADAIITIGRLPETGNTRYLYVPKNKMEGNDPALRNGKFEIEILPEIGRWKEAA